MTLPARIKGGVGKRLGSPLMEEAELVYNLFEGTPGVLIEVGAHEGDDTFIKFAASGWEIVAFEPEPSVCARLVLATSRFPNVTVEAKAVADKAGTLTLYTSDESTGIASLTPFTPRHKPGTQVEVVSLTDYLISNGPDRVDFLKLDVEGYERFVIDGYPWDSHRPPAIMLEFEDRKTVPLGYSWRTLASMLRNRGYEVLVSEWFPIVRYGGEHKWRQFHVYPTELRDEAAWGNLIAVETELFPPLLRAARARSRKLRVRRVVNRARGLVTT